MPKIDKFDLIGLLQEHGAILNGHFQIPTGYHTQIYIQPSMVLQYPHLANKIAKALASKFPMDIDVVLSPSVGAMALGQEVARVKLARSIFTERINGTLVLKRKFKIHQGEKVLIVDDVFNSGKRCSEAAALARDCGAKVIGIAALVDRSTGDLGFNIPIRSLLSYPLELFRPEDCPLCRQKIPLTVPGVSETESGTSDK